MKANWYYYLIQARAILRTGCMGIPDFPLLFYIQAGVGAFFSLFTPTDRAIFIAVRLTDTIIPVLIAVPVFLFVRAFNTAGERRYTPTIAAMGVGLIAVGNRSLLHMAGDFQKNAAALPLFLAFTFFLYLSLRNHRRRDIIVTLIFFCLTCLTHIGAAALTLLYTGFFVIVGIISNKNYKLALVIVSTLAVSLLLSLGLVSLFDPERAVKLLAASFNPGKLVEGSLVSTWAGIGCRNQPLELDGIILGNVTGIIGLATAVLYRKHMDHAARICMYAASLTALVLASPFIGRDLAQRLCLMAFVPGLIPLAFIVSRQQWIALFSLAPAVVLFFTTVLVFSVFGIRIMRSFNAVFFLEEINPEAFTGGDFQHRHARPPTGPTFMYRPPRRNVPIPPPAPFPGSMGGQGFHGPDEIFLFLITSY